jgi:hypothetical protein
VRALSSSSLREDDEAAVAHRVGQADGQTRLPVRAPDIVRSPENEVRIML